MTTQTSGFTGLVNTASQGAPQPQHQNMIIQSRGASRNTSVPQNRGEAEGYYQGDDAFFAQDPYMAAVGRQPGYNPSSNVMPPAMQQMTSMLFGAAGGQRR